MDPAVFSDVISCKIKNVNVTCLKCVDSHILAGQAGDLHIYELSKLNKARPKKLFHYEIFPSQNIYGIIPKNEEILIFGGKSVAILSGNLTSYESVFIVNSWKAEDWILDGIWSDDANIILLTAHNVLLQYKLSPTFQLAGKLVCEERCILYSGKIFGSKLDDIVVIAGTVYQEVIVWVPSTENSASDTNIPVLQRLKGHKGVIFCTAYDEKNQCIASTSDDRTVRVWSVKFPEENHTVSYKWSAAEINLAFTAFGHTARVWRCLFTPSGHLATAGEDSTICLWDKKGGLVNRWVHCGEIWCIDYYKDQLAVGGNGITIRLISCVPEISTLSLSDHGIPRQTVLNSFGTPIIFFDQGFMMKSKYIEDSRFLNYCTLSISQCRNYLVLGSISGQIVLYRVLEDDFTLLCDINLNKGKIFSLTWASKDTFIACGENGSLSMIKFDHANDVFLTVIHTFTLPPSKERWLNCAIILENALICGDRMGSLHLYYLDREDKVPLHTFTKLHGVKGVSDLKYINGLLYSTGRDGTLKELEIIDDCFNLISTLKLPMDWAAGILLTEKYGILIAGFHGVNFILWSAQDRLTLLILECGGGNRSFDYYIDEKEENLIITFIRMKNVKYMNSNINTLAHQTVHVSYHSKSINSGCVLYSDSNKAVILTGGEDNTLRLCNLKYDDTWCSYGVYAAHISAIRTVKCINDIVVSGGGRGQIIIWGVVKNKEGYIYLKELKSHMIREERKYHKSWRDSKPLVDPETRYMDLAVVRSSDSNYNIFAACSDGMLRIFDFIEKSRDIILLKSIESNQGCLLKVLAYHWKEKLCIVTAGTKGSVAFWYAPIEDCPSRAHSVHSMGINAMDHVIIGNSLILGTGGDDTTVALTVFSLNQNKPEQIAFNIVEHIHTCQVSGLKITSEFLISASLDQKICILHWQFDGNFLKTNLLGHIVSSISDIHGISTWLKNETVEKDLDIVVFGCGLQYIRFCGSLLNV